jgi:hypothetical protein
VSALVPRPRAGVSTAGGARKPQYVSPGTAGISVFIRGATAGDGSLKKVLDQIPIPAAPTVVASQAFSFPATVGGAAFTGCTTDGCAVSYSWAPSTTAGSYLFTINFSGLLQSANGSVVTSPPTELVGGYTFGFVLQDTTHNGFVLSEGEKTATVIASVGTTPVSLTLNPVIGSGFLCDATCSGNLPAPLVPLTAMGLTTTPAGPASSYEVAAYVGDELGYLIPSGQTLETGASYTVKECSASTPGSSCSSSPGILNITTCATSAAVIATAATGGLDPIPPCTVAGLIPLVGQTTTSGIAFPLISDAAIPASGGVGPPVLATAGAATVSAGLSVNVQCTAVGQTHLAIVATQPNGGTVHGFDYSNFAPKNFPVSGIVSTAPSASQGGPLGGPTIGNALDVNCSPGAGITIN